jgi:hypothetical protein
MTLRLHTRTENGEHGTIGTRKMVSATAETAAVRISVDQPAVHRYDRFTGFRTKEEDHGVMRRDPLIVRVKRDQLGAERATVSRHHSEEALVLGHWQDQPHRLLDLARGKIAQRARHRRDQLYHPQTRANLFFVEKHHCSGGL